MLCVRDLPAQQADEVQTVVFLGDSITEGGAHPGGYLSLLQTAFAGNKSLKLVGAGISGNRVPDLQARLDRDVLSRKPALVVIYIGINDVWHSQSGNGTPADRYESGLRDLIARIQAAGSRVLLCTPSVIGELTDGSNPLDEMLDQYSAISRKVASETGSHLFDLRSQFLRELKILNPSRKASGILTTDGVHLNPAGNQFLCDCLRPELMSLLPQGPVRHVVLFRFRATSSQADINRVCDAFAQLPEQIESVRGFEMGRDISPEQLSQGYTHCFILTFADPAGRDGYLKHPAHQAFVELAIPHLELPLVVDFQGR